jgi:hypothetical protein
MTDSHWGFIVAAYLVSALVVGGITLKILLDYRGLRHSLGKLAGLTATREELP